MSLSENSNDEERDEFDELESDGPIEIPTDITNDLENFDESDFDDDFDDDFEEGIEGEYILDDPEFADGIPTVERKTPDDDCKK